MNDRSTPDLPDRHLEHRAMPVDAARSAGLVAAIADEARRPSSLRRRVDVAEVGAARARWGM